MVCHSAVDDTPTHTFYRLHAGSRALTVGSRIGVEGGEALAEAFSPQMKSRSVPAPGEVVLHDNGVTVMHLGC
jgi:hypothetical protein